MKKGPGPIGVILGLVLIVAGVIGGRIAVDAALNPPPRSVNVWTSNVEAVRLYLPAGLSMGVWMSGEEDVRCNVWYGDATSVPLQTSGFVSQTRDDLTLVATFATPIDAVYRFWCDTDGDPIDVMIEPEHETSQLPATVVAGIVLSSAGVLVGLVFLVVTFVRWLRWDRTYRKVGS